MHRRTVLLGLVAAGLPLPALAAPPPRWQSVVKRRFAPAGTYRRPNGVLNLPVRPDLPLFPSLALKLTGGPLWLEGVEYHYAGLSDETHAVETTVQRGQILALPAPSHPLLAVKVVSRSYADGHRYWHLIGTFDRV